MAEGRKQTRKEQGRESQVERCSGRSRVESGRLAEAPENRLTALYYTDVPMTPLLNPKWDTIINH